MKGNMVTRSFFYEGRGEILSIARRRHRALKDIAATSKKGIPENLGVIIERRLARNNPA
jgi:hypothetical protein